MVPCLTRSLLSLHPTAPVSCLYQQILQISIYSCTQIIIPIFLWHFIFSNAISQSILNFTTTSINCERRKKNCFHESPKVTKTESWGKRLPNPVPVIFRWWLHCLPRAVLWSGNFQWTSKKPLGSRFGVSSEKDQENRRVPAFLKRTRSYC